MNLYVSIGIAIIGIIASGISFVLYFKAKQMIDETIENKLEDFVTKQDLLQHQIECRAINDKEYAPIELKDSIKELSEKLDKIYEILIKRP